MTDYSQFGEQAHILASLEGMTGKFADIGAWHPTCFSNTRALWELGWEGLFVEPSPPAMLNLLKEYGNEARATLLQAVVHPIDSCPIGLYVSDDAISTTDDNHYITWRNQAQFLGSVLVPAIPVIRLLQQFGNFDFVNIDTEGTSVQVFSAWMQTSNRPRCVCIEHDGNIVELNQIAEGSNYRQVHLNGTNAIFEWKVPRR